MNPVRHGLAELLIGGLCALFAGGAAVLTLAAAQIYHHGTVENLASGGYIRADTDRYLQVIADLSGGGRLLKINILLMSAGLSLLIAAAAIPGARLAANRYRPPKLLAGGSIYSGAVAALGALATLFFASEALFADGNFRRSLLLFF